MSLLSRVQESQSAVVSSSDEGTQHTMDELRKKLKEQLIAMLGLSTISNIAQESNIGTAYNELEVACQTILNTHSYEGITSANQPLLIKEVLDEILGLGPLQPLLDDASVTEVMVNGPSSLFFEREGQMHTAKRVFESDEQILMVVDRILAPLGRRLDEQNQIVNARLANGYRVNVVNKPVALDGPILTIRKFSDRIASLDELVQLGSLPRWYAQLLSWAVKCRKDIAVAGGTGSGKTTLLNALSCEINPTERIITIEDSAELRFDMHPHVVRLEVRESSLEGTGQVTIRDLVKNALRMRPDRIVVGEVRGEECIDMLQAMNTGHDGSLTTLHAGTAREALLRLVLMARFGMNLPVDVIEEQVATALDLIVMSARLPDGSRVITSAAEVFRGAAGGIQVQDFISYDLGTKSWKLLYVPTFIKKSVEEGRLSRKEVDQWKQSCLQEP
ncbi:CpaF family protein [Atopobium fossor]|uniref:CpaF family protein n=1 Tax=Atopobium fossor TaxID=39487 RepID=UPI0003F7A7F7|nr:CpaF family protein [Atopobium fossor]